MNPKEKAKELVSKIMDEGAFALDEIQYVKKCALICVDEIIGILPSHHIIDGEEYNNTQYNYWQEVKQYLYNSFSKGSNF